MKVADGHVQAVQSSIDTLTRLHSAVRELDRTTADSEGILRESRRLLERVRADQDEPATAYRTMRRS